MNNVLLWIVTALYASQASVYIGGGQYAPALILIGYTIANLGLLWSFK